MRFVNDGNFRIAPFDFDRILELTIEKRVNEHATLYVKGVVNFGWNDFPVSNASEGTNVRCEDNENVFFSGVMQSVSIAIEDGVYYLEARAVSNTIKLDTQRHKRAFQDTGWTYEDIVGAIIGECGGAVSYHADAKSVERILVQYDETDWQFAKRLASHTNDALLSISKSDDSEFHFGLEDESCAGEIVSPAFSIFKDFDLLRSRSNDEQPLDESGATMYRVKTDDFAYGMFDAGEKVRLNGKDLFVNHALLSLEDSVIYCEYVLCQKSAVTAPKTYNPGITGLALSGIVQIVAGDTVKLDLSIDYKAGTVQFFQYATDYSPESHTGWYVMPEPGDTVFLVFPSEDEKDAHASSSMRQGATDRTSDPLVKYLRTPFGKEMKLNDMEALFTAKDGETFIKVNESTGIDIITTQPMKINSDETMDIISTGDMRISTEANLSISAKTSIELVCGGNIVNIVPAAGITASTDKTNNIYAKSDINIKSGAVMALTSAKDMIITSGNKLMEFGITGFSLGDEKNSISMEPFKGISISAKKKMLLASIGEASIASITALSLSAKKNLEISTRGRLKKSGNASKAISSGKSTIEMTPASVNIKGTKIKENK